jgi:uncharacterized surface protein with fasciclin (FAS1) repeats
MTTAMRRLAAVATITLMVPAACSAQQSAPAEVQSTKDIVTVAVEAGSFKTLVAAIQAAGLVEVLQGAGPFTVFAPTDEAFAKLPAGTVEALLADREKLAAILTYHVVAGRVEAADIVQAGTAQPTTVQGQKLDVRVVNGAVRVDGATVTTADVGASNGVIHVIDTVMLPKAEPAEAGTR